MLFTNPGEDQLYEALLARDDAYEGQVWVGVTSTGIFCRLTCSAVKPKRENTRFFDSVEACLAAGFRPCKRCHPMSAAGAAHPVVSLLVEKVLADPDRRWSERDLVDEGFDPSTVRRAFHRQFGVTFISFARSMRVARGAQRLGRRDPVIDAQIAAGFDSGSGFRDALAKKLGVAPSRLAVPGQLRASLIDTPLGTMLASANDDSLMLLEFFDRAELPSELQSLQHAHGASITVGHHPVLAQIERELQAYFEGRSCEFATPLCLGGTEFARIVWKQLRQIPCGTTVSYQHLAHSIGRPTATRAVARANGANVIAIVIPCHRVIGADGSLAGYAAGTWRKQWLIDHERRHF